MRNTRRLSSTRLQGGHIWAVKMRWFKHLTRSHEDEKMARVLDKFGPGGYGCYWIILELIAANMESCRSTSLTIPLKKWSKSCGFSVKKFQNFVRFLSDIGCISVELQNNSENLLQINCPNLLKYKDEYLRKSGQTPDKLPKHTESESDTESETEIDKRNTITDEAVKLPPKSEKQPSKKPDSEMRIFTDWWCSEFEARFGSKYAFEKKDGVMCAQILKALGLDESKRRATLFLDSDDDWICQAGKTIPIFRTKLNSFASDFKSDAPKISKALTETMETLDRWEERMDKIEGKENGA